MRSCPARARYCTSRSSSGYSSSFKALSASDTAGRLDRVGRSLAEIANPTNDVHRLRQLVAHINEKVALLVQIGIDELETRITQDHEKLAERLSIHRNLHTISPGRRERTVGAALKNGVGKHIRPGVAHVPSKRVRAFLRRHGPVPAAAAKKARPRSFLFGCARKLRTVPFASEMRNVTSPLGASLK